MTLSAFEDVVKIRRARRIPAVRLEPESGAAVVDGKLHAVSLPCWLRLEPIEFLKRRAWVKLRYAAGFFDDPVRPLIRFVTANGKISIQPMNGPVLGTAEWIGRIPNGTVSVSISPGRRLGPISFRIERIEPIARRVLMRAGFLSDPPWAFWSVRSRLLNSREEAWQALKYARGGTPLKRYREWHERLTRPLELDGIDKPRADWARTPRFHLFMRLDDVAPARLAATLAALRAQVYPRWLLHAVTDKHTPAALLADYRPQMHEEERFLEVRDGASPARIAADDRIATIDAGDALTDYALAAMAEAMAEAPETVLAYSDEDAVAPNGTPHAPALKPDWSPIFQQARGYIGRLACLRYDALTSFGLGPLDLLLDEDTTLERVLGGIDPKLIRHVRRILYRRRMVPGTALRTVPLQPIRQDPQWPEVSIIIPTRDHFDFLSTCVQTLQNDTDYPSFNVVVVDNGSTERDALELLSDLRGNARFKVLDRPIPFNYSRLCNDGARETGAPILVFLNNDIQFFDAGWLKAMVHWAVRPEIGVVGAKLLFPNSRIEHAGVVLGMGGLSGHVYRRSPREERGYLHQLECVRETLANTAACIAVAREKFEAIGGFDADNLPVDLNDIDLCLRIAERGWTNLWTPEAIMVHAQSGSRGIEKDPFKIYQQERTYFMHRWAEAIRDDRYFHPGLSLFCQRPALG